MSAPAIDTAEIAARQAKARRLAERAGFDALLVTQKYNYWYLTGHLSREFDKLMRPILCLLPVTGEPVLIVYAQQRKAAGRLSPGAAVMTYEDVPFPVELIAEALSSLGLRSGRIGMEFGEYERLGISVGQLRALEVMVPGATFADGDAVYSELRLCKSPAEVAVIKRACDLTLGAWEKAVARFETGMVNRDLKRILSEELSGAGSDFDIAGHVTIGNGVHGDTPYERAQTVWADFGASLQGYQADVARRAVFGPPPAEVRDAQARIADILEAEIAAIRPGRRTCDVAQDVSDALVRAGYPPLGPKKRVGHGLGLSASEVPSIGLADETLLRPGMVLTPEPRFNLASGEKVHIEDVVVVTETGCERLSRGAGTLAIID
jgi:Xaa-Pro aminopeptidase